MGDTGHLPEPRAAGVCVSLQEPGVLTLLLASVSVPASSSMALVHSPGHKLMTFSGSLCYFPETALIYSQREAIKQ